jgi:hypothetical protein
MKFARYIGYVDITDSDGEAMAKHNDILTVHAKTDDEYEYVVKGKRSEFYFIIPTDRIEIFKEV